MDDERTNMLHNEQCKSMNLSLYYPPSQSKSDSEVSCHKRRPSKIKSCNKLPERFDLLGNGNFFDYPESTTDISISSLLFNQAKGSERKNQILSNLKLHRERNKFPSLPFITDKLPISGNSKEIRSLIESLWKYPQQYFSKST